MSLKENIEMVKEELSQEEKLFESAVRTERFVKKYKMPLIGALAVMVVVLAGNAIYQANVSSKIKSSNEAYMKLLASPADASAIKTLKESNEALYDAWRLQLAISEKNESQLQKLILSSSDVVADLASYELAAIKKDKKSLNAYSQKELAILKDMALLDESVLLMKESKIEEARADLAKIDDKSSAKKIATMLQHYGVK